MSITIHSNTSPFQSFLTYDTFDTVILSTQNSRYRTMRNAKVYQISSADILQTALVESSCATFVLDLLDDVVKSMPKALGAFLDDFEEDVYCGTNLVIVYDNKDLIQEWELFDVSYI